MDNQKNIPWYVRYHIVPDSKKPRTPLMGFAHGYVSFWLALWTVGLAIGGVVLIISDQSFGTILTALLLFAASYGGFWLLKREGVRTRKR